MAEGRASGAPDTGQRALGWALVSRARREPETPRAERGSERGSGIERHEGEGKRHYREDGSRGRVPERLPEAQRGSRYARENQRDSQRGRGSGEGREAPDGPREAPEALSTLSTRGPLRPLRGPESEERGFRIYGIKSPSFMAVWLYFSGAQYFQGLQRLCFEAGKIFLHYIDIYAVYWALLGRVYQQTETSTAVGGLTTYVII